jgi:hypothetical protein
MPTDRFRRAEAADEAEPVVALSDHGDPRSEVERLLGGLPTAPWTIAGGPDPAYTAADRQRHRRWLTDPGLTERFQRLHPQDEPVYERMIRALELVWDCPDDGTVNVVGYRCSGCGVVREVALLAERCRDGS